MNVPYPDASVTSRKQMPIFVTTNQATIMTNNIGSVGSVLGEEVTTAGSDKMARSASIQNPHLQTDDAPR